MGGVSLKGGQNRFKGEKGGGEHHGFVKCEVYLGKLYNGKGWCT